MQSGYFFHFIPGYQSSLGINRPWVSRRSFTVSTYLSIVAWEVRHVILHLFRRSYHAAMVQTVVSKGFVASYSVLKRTTYVSLVGTGALLQFFELLFSLCKFREYHLGTHRKQTGNSVRGLFQTSVLYPRNTPPVSPHLSVLRRAPTPTLPK